MRPLDIPLWIALLFGAVLPLLIMAVLVATLAL